MHPMKHHYFLHQIKAKQFYTDLELHQQCKSLQKKVFSCVFLGLKSIFQYFSRKISFSVTSYEILLYSSTLQACANPAFLEKK